MNSNRRPYSAVLRDEKSGMEQTDPQRKTFVVRWYLLWRRWRSDDSVTPDHTKCAAFHAISPRYTIISVVVEEDFRTAQCSDDDALYACFMARSPGG